MAPFASLHASDPYTVFLDPDPSVYTGFWDVDGAPGGEVYAVGFMIENDDPAYEVVLRSLDRGATWKTASEVTDSHGTFINAAVDGAGNLYVVTSGSGGGTGGEIWRSAAPDQGVNLQRVTSFNSVLPSGYRLRTETLAADAAGNVFVGGYRPVTSGRTTLARWMVARGNPISGGGLNWSVVDEFTVDSKYGSFATGLAVRPSNDPTAPSEVWVRTGRLSGVHPETAVAVKIENSRFEVLDVSDPASPLRLGGIGNVQPNFFGRGLAVADGTLYVAADSGLWVFDLANPAPPQLLGDYDTHWGVNGMVISGDHAFLTDGRMGLHILDLSDPDNPVRVGGHRTSGSPGGVAVQGEYAYVVDYSTMQFHAEDSLRLQVLNVRTPSNPELVGGCDLIATGGAPPKVTVSGYQHCRSRRAHRRWFHRFPR